MSSTSLMMSESSRLSGWRCGPATRPHARPPAAARRAEDDGIHPKLWTVRVVTFEAFN